jgi:hypothetical protein
VLAVAGLLSSCSAGSRYVTELAPVFLTTAKEVSAFSGRVRPTELDGFVENNLTSLEPHAGRLPTDIKMYHKERKEWEWVPVCLKTPIP